VILDCCHAGSGTRGVTAQTGDRARGGYINSTIPAQLDIELLNGISRARGLGFPSGNHHQGLDTHVLLAACAPHEQAWEHFAQDRGYFTTELLRVLRNTGDEVLTYERLIGTIPTRSRQHPQCEGFNKHRTLFNLEPRQHGRPLFQIAKGKDSHLVKAGTAHGIHPGALFHLYKNDAPNSRKSPIGYLIADKVDQYVSSVSPHRSSRLPELRGGEVVGLVQLSTDSELQVSWTTSDSRYKDLLREVKTTLLADERFGSEEAFCGVHFLDSPRDEKWQVCVTISNDSAKFHVHHTRLFPDLRTRAIPSTCSPNAGKIAHILRSAAKYYWHLRRDSSDSESSLRKRVSVALRPLDGPHYDEDDPGDGHYRPQGDFSSQIVEHGRQTRILAAKDHLYGLEVRNKADRELYIATFYFANDFRIESLSAPVLSNGKADVSLKRRSSHTYGFGDGGGDPFEFTLEEWQDQEVEFFKIFLSTDPLDLVYLEQENPFEAGCDSVARGGKRVSGPKVPLPAWTSIVIPIVQTR